MQTARGPRPIRRAGWYGAVHGAVRSGPPGNTRPHALEAKGTANGYGQVYGELYRRYRVASYKNLLAARFDAVLAWLRTWYEELTGEAPAEQGRLFCAAPPATPR